MRYNEIITEAAVPAISPQQAKDAKMFGPMYHGTTGDLAEIIAQGFDPKKSIPTGIGKFGFGWVNRPVGTSNGYPLDQYAWGIAAPIHHLGFGSYFTTVKAIAKQYSGGTMKGQRIFYLDSHNIHRINFGSSNTMMKWWKENGYDMTDKETRDRNMEAWIRATMNLTKHLSERYDAVHFLGKGIRKLLDGDQICVYKTDLVRVIDPKLATGLEVGSKVIHTQEMPSEYRGRNSVYIDDVPSAGPGWKGVYDVERAEEAKATGREPYAFHVIPPPGMWGIITDVRDNPHHGTMYDVKWQRGGVRHNYKENELKIK